MNAYVPHIVGQCAIVPVIEEIVVGNFYLFLMETIDLSILHPRVFTQ